MAILAVSQFKGLRSNSNPSKLEDGESTILANLDVSDRGSLVKRNGLAQVTLSNTLGGTARPRPVGRYKTSTVDRIIYADPASGGNTWYHDLPPTSWSFLGTYETYHMVNYGGYAWLIAMDGLHRYDGTTVTSKAGAAWANHQGVIYRDRMFVCNYQNANNAVYFSQPYGTYNWLDDASWPANNYDQFDPGDGDRVVGIAVLNDILMVFKSRKIYAYYTQSADITQWSWKVANASLGCISYRTMVEIEGLLYFEAREGIYRTDGITFEEVSVPIRDVFRNRPGAVTDLFDKDGAVRWGNKYVLFFNDVTNNNYRTMVYDFINQTWSEYAWGTTGSIRPDAGVATPDAAPWTLYTNSRAHNTVYRIGDPTLYTDVGGVYAAQMRSKYYDFEKPAEWKKSLEANVDLKTGQSGTTEARWIHEDTVGGVYTQLLAPATIAPQSYLAPLAGPGYFRRVALEIYHDDPYALEILGFDMNVLEKRKAYARVRG